MIVLKDTAGIIVVEKQVESGLVSWYTKRV